MRQVEPPKLRDLIARCHRLGYAEPEILIGVSEVQVQLHSNEHGRRNVVGKCAVSAEVAGDVGWQLAERLAVRSALAQALDLAATREALPA